MESLDRDCIGGIQKASNNRNAANVKKLVTKVRHFSIGDPHPKMKGRGKNSKEDDLSEPVLNSADTAIDAEKQHCQFDRQFRHGKPMRAWRLSISAVPDSLNVTR